MQPIYRQRTATPQTSLRLFASPSFSSCVNRVAATLRRTVLCLLLFPPCLQAQTPRVVCAEIAPFCYVENGVNRGYIYEIGEEIQRRLKQPIHIEIQPLARSLHNVQKNSRVISLWVGRIPERENTVRWISPIVNDAFHIYTLKGKPDASTIEKARELGLLSATIAGANVVAAQHLSLSRIDATSMEESNGKKLLNGRVDGWITANATFTHFLLTQGRTRDEFVRGVKLADYRAYIAASLDLDDKTANDWARAYQSMRNDGHAQRIMKKYGITEQ